MDMTRSVSQLMYQYLPDRTVNWEDGAGIVRLSSPRLASAWPLTKARFVLQEVERYLTTWRTRGGIVDNRFPPPGSTDRFAVGTPSGIEAHFLKTAFYCRDCFRFLPTVRAGAGQLECPDCRRPTLRQVSYVFVHGCGELRPIRESIPIQSARNPGSIFDAHIVCPNCSNKGILRMDARAERLSELSIRCDRCHTEVIDLRATCPRCFPRLHAEMSAGADAGQLAFRVAMRITRHSANNAYYPHTITILRLDRPRLIQRSEEQRWLESFLVEAPGRQDMGVSHSLAELADQLRVAEQHNDVNERQRLLREIARAAGAEGMNDGQSPPPPVRRQVQDDVSKSALESLALLSSVRRTRVFSETEETATDGSVLPPSAGAILRRMGIQRLELISELPLVTATFGYSRRSSDATYAEERAARDTRFPTTLRPFPVLEQSAAQAAGDPRVMGQVPILAREGLHEGLALFLNPEAVLAWLAVHEVRVEGATTADRVAHVMELLEPVDAAYDGVWACPVRRLVYGLLHSVSHCAMKALSLTAGLEGTSVSEYIFLPLMCSVVYSTASVELGGVRRVASERVLEFAESLQEQASRCIYDPHCLEHHGACHGCLHVPEIACRVFNHGLSRAFLTGGRVPWAAEGDRTHLSGFWELTARL